MDLSVPAYILAQGQDMYDSAFFTKQAIVKGAVLDQNGVKGNANTVKATGVPCSVTTVNRMRGLSDQPFTQSLASQSVSADKARRLIELPVHIFVNPVTHAYAGSENPPGGTLVEVQISQGDRVLVGTRSYTVKDDVPAEEETLPLSRLLDVERSN